MTANPDLLALARFLPEFERADFSPGDWAPVSKLAETTYQMPYVAFSPIVTEFVQAAYDGGWVRMDFAWPEWKNTQEARALHDDPDVLAQASARQLAQLLTVFTGQDRFVEGVLLDAFESGHILGIVRRAAKLLEGPDGASSG